MCQSCGNNWQNCCCCHRCCSNWWDCQHHYPMPINEAEVLAETTSNNMWWDNWNGNHGCGNNGSSNNGCGCGSRWD